MAALFVGGVVVLMLRAALTGRTSDFWNIHPQHTTNAAAKATRSRWFVNILRRIRSFLGRLATSGYLDMWMAVAQAMAKLRHNL